MLLGFSGTQGRYMVGKNLEDRERRAHVSHVPRTSILFLYVSVPKGLWVDMPFVRVYYVIWICVSNVAGSRNDTSYYVKTNAYRTVY